MKALNLMKIGIACDHAGYELKNALIDHLKSKGCEVINCGTDSAKSVDYPDYGHKLAKIVKDGTCDYGVAICGSGNGINMTVNHHNDIRSALCWREDIAELARLHNNANIIALPARFIDENLAKKLVDIFLQTPFEGGRHQRRVEKINL